MAHPSASREGLAALVLAASWTAAGAVATGAWFGGVWLSRWETPQPLQAFHPVLAGKPAGPVLDAVLATHGRDLFQQTCAVCHGPGGMGKPSLGKSLVHSDFVLQSADEQLAQFLAQGRPADDPLNTTKVLMPPRGGNDKLTDQDLVAIVCYVRGLQDPRRMPQMTAYEPPSLAPTQADKDAALSAAGGDAELAGYIASGNKLFHSICVACHGQNGVGIQGNGKALVHNDFIKSLNDDDLLAFIKKGRDPGDPKNTTGVGMPPKGGNPALSDDDLLDIIAYVRTLQGGPVAGKPN